MGADSPQGEGWWQATDGQWYPPESAPGPVSAPYAASDAITTGRGFMGSLFDTTFTNFITPKILKILFWFGVIINTLFALFLLVGALGTGEAAAIILALIFIPILWLFYVVLTRVWIEILIVFFRIEENTRT